MTGKALTEEGLHVRADGAAKPLVEWLRFDGVSLEALKPFLPSDLDWDEALLEEVSEDARYAPYLARQEAELRDLRANEQIGLGDAFDYANVPGLSREMTERLQRAQPATLAAAGRVPGITPAALVAILVHAKQMNRQAA